MIEYEKPSTKIMNSRLEEIKQEYRCEINIIIGNRIQPTIMALKNNILILQKDVKGGRLTHVHEQMPNGRLRSVSFMHIGPRRG